jgi:hypothetical protein
MLPENETLAEARRHMAVCNACRYCESYCAVFPAMTMRRESLPRLQGLLPRLPICAAA